MSFLVKMFLEILVIFFVVQLFEISSVQSGACLLPKLMKRSYDLEPLPRPRLDGRIVGGKKINITDAPHQVSLQTSYHFCGGSIISSKWILTAAHCTNGRTAQSLRIRLGSSESAKGGELVEVAKIVQHNEFNNSNIDYDFSLLELVSEINYDDTKQAARLPDEKSLLKDGDPSFVSGWGYTLNSSESREWLRQVEVPVFNQKLCSEKYEHVGEVTERMICAGYSEGGKDACQGDSGGPMVDENGVLIGVVSWGYGCAKAGYPGVYARVSSVRGWIKEHSGI